MRFRKIHIVGLLVTGASLWVPVAFSQTADYWHGKERTLHYRPDGQDIVLVKGTRKFNRALYGTNTAFRVEAGDRPEFALYMPGMGGNLQFVLQSGDKMIRFDDLTLADVRYASGSMVYTINDNVLGGGQLQITVLAQADEEGMIVEVNSKNVPDGIALIAVYGGASGKTFSRAGDIGADPESSFYLLPEYCEHNTYQINKNNFQVSYPNKKGELQYLAGSFSGKPEVRLINASALKDVDQLWTSKASTTPAIAAKYKLNQTATAYVAIQRGQGKGAKAPQLSLQKLFDQSKNKVQTLAGRIRLHTPDEHINTVGSALVLAADGIWESPTYLHGAVAWRMRLNAWRGAYVANPLGWNDRAEAHFRSYVNSQVTEPAVGKVIADTALNIARHLEKMGTAMFSSGYISRNPNNNTVPHHYDMNLVFFDQLFTHFQYTGDRTFLKEVWPAIKRHLAWEKRNFDMDGDGLYDAYCAIWASDGLQYSGGGVTHTSAYNYRGNMMAARLAKVMGEDPAPYAREAEKIRQALLAKLWIRDKGYFAEFKDLLGEQLLHDQPGVWTIYHALDGRFMDSFQAYQALRYIDDYIPHIPVRVADVKDQGLYTLSTTNWQPYTWSVNNVALAENLQTALAYWQAGREGKAFELWKSNLVESMFYGASPGNFQQLSFYDAERGELYRDFADPIGVASRTLFEGLYGILPDALADTLTIQPGWPGSWEYSTLESPNIDFDFKLHNNVEHYTIRPKFQQKMNLKLVLKARKTGILSLSVNGIATPWKMVENAVGAAKIEIVPAKADHYDVQIRWADQAFENISYSQTSLADTHLSLQSGKAKIMEINDPQGLLESQDISKGTFQFKAKRNRGTFFVKVKQQDFSWWQPVDVRIAEPLALTVKEDPDQTSVTLTMTNQSGKAVEGILFIDQKQVQSVQLAQKETRNVVLPMTVFQSGTNTLQLMEKMDTLGSVQYSNWTLPLAAKVEVVDLKPYFNDAVTQLFQNKYWSPRPASPTLQLPVQGIGNWCYPNTTATIDDAGLRAASVNGVFNLPNGLSFGISAAKGNNILFTSQWDNFPTEKAIPLSGKAKHAYFLMAGSTNPMQSQLVNAIIQIQYRDGTTAELALRNPENWWPVEQDFSEDPYAFVLKQDRPLRVHLKTGKVVKGGEAKYVEIKGFTKRGIDGGAATVLDLPLDARKELKSLKLKTIANDVVVGLMGVSLLR